MEGLHEKLLLSISQEKMGSINLDVAAEVTKVIRTI